jgi:hypothetical protein
MLHPDLLRLLAEARHADLLNERRSRPLEKRRSQRNGPRFLRAGSRVGSLIMRAGLRLIDDKPDAPDLALNRRQRVAALPVAYDEIT